jgi:hypothetical protein
MMNMRLGRREADVERIGPNAVRCRGISALSLGVGRAYAHASFMNAPEVFYAP